MLLPLADICNKATKQTNGKHKLFATNKYAAIMPFKYTIARLV